MGALWHSSAYKNTHTQLEQVGDPKRFVRPKTTSCKIFGLVKHRSWMAAHYCTVLWLYSGTGYTVGIARMVYTSGIGCVVPPYSSSGTAREQLVNRPRVGFVKSS